MAVARGIPAEKMVVIPNGIDTKRFHLDMSARKEARNNNNLPEATFLVGIIGRLDPVKDHATFLKAAARVLEEKSNVQFVVVGSGEKSFESQLTAIVKSLGIEGDVFWIPSQKDLNGIYNMLDICVSSSIGEGFSNVISEAMSCEVPCIATDVGDSAMIIGDTGIIVPAGAPDKMAAAMIRLNELPGEDRKQLGKLARNRIITQFSVEKMVQSTIQEFDKLG
jgi:glycosyltransferase involved in cell wall biosynthesis